jgi:hypothetical protein
MPIPTERPSLTTDLLSRYNNQRAGGAFDAHQAGTSTSDPSALARQFTNSDKFIIREPLLVSNFKGANNSNYTEISSLASGLDTRKYKG